MQLNVILEYNWVFVSMAVGIQFSQYSHFL